MDSERIPRGLAAGNLNIGRDIKLSVAIIINMPQKLIFVLKCIE